MRLKSRYKRRLMVYGAGGISLIGGENKQSVMRKPDCAQGRENGGYDGTELKGEPA
ncbi:hypothetical protein J19TS2_03370 [Cohnella xylanilytica]|nr:hypothetical protein J19TS2_03370 [Cohnella xylanilytica]